VLKELDVLVVIADGTNGDEIIKRDLARANRKSLPTNLIYPADPNQPAIMLPEVLSPDVVIKALRTAAKMK
jgi:thiol:disulfide interchange protein